MKREHIISFAIFCAFAIFLFWDVPPPKELAFMSDHVGHFASGIIFILAIVGAIVVLPYLFFLFTSIFTGNNNDFD